MVLVTGATVFVGAAVVRRLTADGHEVEALVWNAAKGRTLLGGDVVVRQGDMMRPHTYAPLVQNVDVVVHAAMLSSPGRLATRRAQQLLEADHLMTTTLADACVQHGRRLIYTGGCFDWG